MSKIELPPHIFIKNDRGLIEAIDIMTGRVLAVQSSEADILSGKADRVTRINTPEGPIFIENSLNFDMVGRLKSYPYSKTLGDLICEQIVHGKSIQAACEEMNIPYSIVLHWSRQHPEFKEAMAQAKKDRAEWMHGELLEVARTKADTKTHIEALKWSAEKDDPEKFGARTKISGDPNAPVSFIIDTGIRRDVTPKEEGPIQIMEPQDTKDQTEEIELKGALNGTNK